MMFGASSFAAFPAELKDHVNSIELYIPKLDIYEGKRLQTSRLEKVVDELSVYGFSSTVHAPYFADSSTYPEALLVDTASMGEREFLLIEESIALATRIEASVVVLHPGRIGPDRQKSFSSMVENLRDLASTAEDYGVLLGLENKESTDPLNLCCEAEELVRAIDAVGSDHLKATFDIGHANLACGGDPEKLGGFVQALGKHIVHVHLHDNSGQKTPVYDGDEHLAPGKGCVDYSVLNLIPDYRGIYNLEVFSLEDVRAGKEFLENILKNNE
ncbi:MAG: sugar phosphate isomerase/epimerase [Methanosarcinaceae archaeon]|nr:sugar phosphate isomerase/epimerase [Methanosarcinaceae archaeon]